MEDYSKSKKKRLKRKAAEERRKEMEKSEEKTKAVFVKKLKKKMRNRANRSSKLFRAAVEMHHQGCCKNDASTAETKREGNELFKKAVRELDAANELGVRIKSVTKSTKPELELVKNGFGLQN